MNRLTDALRYSRRNSYIYGDKWRTLVIVEKHSQLEAVWTEVNALTEASSLLIERASRAARTIYTAAGSIIVIRAVGDLTDAYTLSGGTYTHIIWLYDPEEKVSNYVQAMLRGLVDHDHLRVERAEL